MLRRQSSQQILSTYAQLFESFEFSERPWKSTWGTPRTLVSCLFRVFDGFHVQDRDFTSFPIAEGFFTSFWHLLATLRSNYDPIAFKLHSTTFKLRNNFAQRYTLKALYEKSSRTTIPAQLSNFTFSDLDRKGCPRGAPGTEMIFSEHHSKTFPSGDVVEKSIPRHAFIYNTCFYTFIRCRQEQGRLGA